jgi:hypothetical protein
MRKSCRHQIIWIKPVYLRKKKSSVGTDRSGKKFRKAIRKNLHHVGSFWKKILKQSQKF